MSDLDPRREILRVKGHPGRGIRLAKVEAAALERSRCVGLIRMLALTGKPITLIEMASFLEGRR